jgi:hypothetical protein
VVAPPRAAWITASEGFETTEGWWFGLLDRALCAKASGAESITARVMVKAKRKALAMERRVGVVENSRCEEG